MTNRMGLVSVPLMVSLSTIASHSQTIQLTPMTAGKYLGANFNGDPLVQLSTGSITPFRDTTTNEFYYLVSDYQSPTSGLFHAINISSNIFDDQLQPFSNPKNEISSQLPYEVYAHNGTSWAGQGLSTCTNPITSDIIACYAMTYDVLQDRIYCRILFNNHIDPFWSPPIQITDTEWRLKFAHFSLQCVDDAYLLFFHSDKFLVQGAPNTFYTLLDINGNVMKRAAHLFKTHAFEYDEFWERDWIQTAKRTRRSDQDEGHFQADFLLELSVSFSYEIDAFFVSYSNISDIDGDGPLYVNYSISGHKLLEFKHAAFETFVRYYEIDAERKCCFLTPYLQQMGLSDLNHTYLYLNMIDAEGRRVFDNDTLIASMVIPKLAAYVNGSASVHQLNIANEVEDGLMYFAIIYFGGLDLYAQFIAIDPLDLSVHVLNDLHLMNFASFHGVPYISVHNIYVDSSMGYDQDVMFMMYQLSHHPNSNFPEYQHDYIQSWKVSVVEE